MDDKLFKQLDQNCKTDGEKNVLKALKRHPQLMFKTVNLQRKIFNLCCRSCQNKLLKDQDSSILCQSCKDKNETNFKELERIKEKLEK